MNKVHPQTDFSSANVFVCNTGMELIDFGNSQGWDFMVLGNAPIPEYPIRSDDWLIVPAHLDNTVLPEFAKLRMDAIFSAGIRPKAWFLVHEAPKLLPPTIESDIHVDGLNQRIVSRRNRQKLRSVLKVVGIAVGVIAVAAGALAVAAFVAAVTLPALLVPAALLLDPILVAVTEDGYWIEIARWEV